MNVVRLNRTIGRYVGQVFGRQMTFLAQVVEDLFGTLPEALEIHVSKDEYGIAVILENPAIEDGYARYLDRKAVYEGSDDYLALSFDLVTYLENTWK